MWGVMPGFINILEQGFEMFLSQLDAGDVTSEYLLPTIIDELLSTNRAKVDVLRSEDKWFGVTYREDKESVVKEMRNLIDSGIYPEKLA